VGAGGVRRGAALIALALVASPALGACASSSNYAEIRPTSHERNVALPTTTIVASTLPTTTTSTVPAGAATLAASSPEAALASVVGTLSSDAGLAAAVSQLRAADAGSLAMILGIDEGLVEELGLTLEQVQGLAAILAGLGGTDGPGTATSATAVDAAVAQLLALAASIDSAALGAIDGLTREVVAGVVGAVRRAMDRVDPTLLAVLTALLDRLDPHGLGSLVADRDSATLLAVFAGATLRTKPDLAPQLRAHAAGDPRTASLVDRLESLGYGMTRRDALALTAIGASMTPEGFGALSRLVDVVQDPTTAALVDRVRNS